MRVIKLVVAYVGTGYHGFQKQPGMQTVQEVLENFLSRVCGERIQIAGSGRTDAGVHALGQVVSFRTNGIIPAGNIPRAALSLLPGDIAVLSAEEMPEDFHARFRARSKEYRYYIRNDGGPDPFWQDRCWFVPGTLDWDLMERGAAFLVGRHDFAAFCSSGSDVLTTVRTVLRAGFHREGRKIVFTIAADGFLYHMVRNIVWTLVQLGQHLWSWDDFTGCLLHPEMKTYIAPAPAGGLYLYRVDY